MLIFLHLLVLLGLCVADVSVTAPKVGASFSGGSTVTISWSDSDPDSSNVFSLANAKSYSILLCAGPNSNIKCFKSFVNNQAIPLKSYSAEIPASLISNGVYFFQIYTVFKKAITINYTPRITLTGMTGPSTTTDALGVKLVLSTLNTFTGQGPDPQTPSGGTGPAPATIDTRLFTVPYTLQTGRTRYAPMQMQPGSTVTMSTWSRRFATSSISSYYVSVTGSPAVVSTITPGWSYTMESAINYASVAADPTSWYSMAARITQATLSANQKRKRWFD